MDANVERPLPGEEEWDGTEEMRKKVLEQYLDELYEMDFNDMVRAMLPSPRYSAESGSGWRHADALQVYEG